ncbi:lysis protein [Enterobacter hormaechei]|uniref:lysis protein n=1 Tax=Enterobacter hormaechei TaxID=158836 RepID=UPI001C5AA785|nr:lysis protein [Enterobacter hormaechei]QXY99469.1 lysis protein [Enterobacter hormaechei subsp. steigerwaltii]
MTAEAILTLVKKFWLPALIAVLIGALAIAASHYKGKAESEAKRADDAERSLNLASATITDMQTRQRDVAALDAKYTGELADAKAENDALQRKLDNGGRVLVKGKCPVPATTETRSSGVGHDATVELSDVAGRNVLGIRSGIKQDQSALRALQEYINTQCLK